MQMENGRANRVEVITPPEMEACGFCFRLNIPRHSIAAQRAYGQRVILKCVECQHPKGKKPNGTPPQGGEK